jgi:hypothetical protein
VLFEVASDSNTTFYNGLFNEKDLIPWEIIIHLGNQNHMQNIFGENYV